MELSQNPTAGHKRYKREDFVISSNDRNNVSRYLTFEASIAFSLIYHPREAAGLDLLEVQLTETTSPALLEDLLP